MRWIKINTGSLNFGIKLKHSSMELLFQNSIGIDIRDDMMCWVHLKTSPKGIRLAGNDFIKIDPALDVSERLREIERVVSGLLRSGNIRDAEIFLSVPGDLAIQRIVEFPSTVRENLSETLMYELDKYVPISADEIYLDSQIIEEVKENSRLKIFLPVVRKKDIDPYISFGRNLGRGAASIEICSTALANYVLFVSKTASVKPYAYWIEDSGRGEFGFLKNGKLYFSRTIRLHGNETDTVEIIERELHHIKEKYGIDDNFLHLSTNNEDLNTGVVGAIGEAEGIGVEVSSFSEDSVSVGRFGAAFGLALKGLWKVPVQINFMPPAFRKKPSRWGYYVAAAMACLVVLAGVVWAGSTIFSQRMMNRRIDDRLESLKTEVAAVNKLENEIAALQGQNDQLVRIRQNYISMLDILKEMTDLIPDTARLTDFSLSAGGITITGSAESASELVSILEASNLFQDVVFSSAITPDRGGLERFRIALKLEK